jgi:sterol desaturase/sphingolipid hydroxylase (fatty acid hydroxylase superfamily)
MRDAETLAILPALRRGGQRLVRLGKASYYADFLFYPAFIVALAGAGVTASHADLIPFALWAAAGLAFWTLLEYAAHRGMLHNVEPFHTLHTVHHQNPGALVGTPTWMTGAAFAVLLFLLWRSFGPLTALGFTTGLAAGYLWYLIIHHALHHWRIRPGSLLYDAKLRHTRHHRRDAAGDYGVTTGFWDWVFGTAGYS